MKYRIAPYWWPLLTAASPVLGPWLAVQSQRFRSGVSKAAEINTSRLERASPLDIPELPSLTLSVIVEHRHAEGFIGDPAVSYLLRNDQGGLLMDVGFGPERRAFAANAARLGLGPDDWNVVLISHLHPDHMGGWVAARRRAVLFPAGFEPRTRTPCYLPGPCSTNALSGEVVAQPRLLPFGLATTGPLARMLCFTGLTDEQAVIARIKGKGLVVITGCGHPTIGVMLEMTRRLSNEPIYAIAGGLHFPITGSRGARLGIQIQQIFGTGKNWWQRITDCDLDLTIQVLQQSGARRLLLSAHDSCDYSLKRIADSVDMQTEVLSAGVTYIF